MSNKTTILGILLFLTPFFALPAMAGKIAKTDIAELSTNSQYIVIGEVVATRQLNSAQDEVKVKVRALLKGNSDLTSFLLPLTVRGTKSFDTPLEVGNKAVFFLKYLSDGQAEKTYYGSIAVFQTHNFQ